MLTKIISNTMWLGQLLHSAALYISPAIAGYGICLRLPTYIFLFNITEKKRVIKFCGMKLNNDKLNKLMNDFILWFFLSDDNNHANDSNDFDVDNEDVDGDDDSWQWCDKKNCWMFALKFNTLKLNILTITFIMLLFLYFV